MAQKKEFDFTSEEVHKLEEALKKEEFRKLLVDYAKEIRDPDNRKKYEEEIAQLERERGQDVKFLSAKPGFVVKVKNKDNRKVFINICQSDIVAKATTRSGKQHDNKGNHWSIPYSLTTVREDVDHASSKCNVIDFVVHPETYALGQKNSRFKEMLVDTAIDGIEEKRGLKLNRKVLRYLKMPYKGTPSYNIIRRPLDDKEVSASSQQENKLPFTIPYPPLNVEEKASSDGVANSNTAVDKAPVTPKYSITHRGEMDLQDYTTDSSFVRSTRPKQLIITINLPGLESANDIELDYDSSSLDLYCPTPPYRLQLMLPYKVNEDEGAAKFEKAKQRLIVTLSVLPMETTVVNTDVNGDDQNSDAQIDLDEAPQENTTTIRTCAESQDDGESSKSCEPEVHHSNNDKLLSAGSHEPLCPAYTYHQTADNVTFILHVPVVKETTLVKSFEPQQFTLAFTTKEAIQYSFAVIFPEGCVLDVTRCSADVSPDNVVIMAAKSDEHRTTWQNFKAGISLIDMQEKLFLTDENVSKQCAASNSHAHSNAELEEELSVSVTELSNDMITISIDQPHPSVDQPHPPADQPHPPADQSHPPADHKETQASSSESHPSCSVSQPSPSSHDPSEPRPSTCSSHCPPHSEETKQPLPLHESSNKPLPQMINNSESHPLTETPSHDNKNARDKPLLVPSNQLLFELD